jgi:hypothetical protein
MLADSKLSAKLDLNELKRIVKSPMLKYTAHNMKYFKDEVEIRHQSRKNMLSIKVDDEQGELLPELTHSSSVKVLSCIQL